MAKAPSKPTQQPVEDVSKAAVEWSVVAETWIGPHLKKKGDTVVMTPDEAKYYVPQVLVPKDGSVKSSASKD